ncbi:unnamed protein product, partial [Phaeothamnion confervicola]
MRVKRGDASTAGLIKHLRMHKWVVDAHSEAEAKTKDSILSFITVNPDFADAHLRWHSETLQPISMCENKYFRRMMDAAARNVHVPSRDTLNGRIIAKASFVRHHLPSVFKEQSIAVSMDTWSSITMDSYACLSGHYIDDKWELKTASLGVERFDGSHNAPSVAAKLKKMHEGIGAKHVVAAVTDTAANMIAAGRLMPYDWHPCVAHTLDLTTKICFNGEERIKEAMKICRSLVTHFKCSSLETQALLDWQKLAGPDKGGNRSLKLIQDVPTRWWSTYAMLARILELKYVLQVMALNGALAGFRLSDFFWSTLAELAELLKPFMEAQKLLEGDSYVTVSAIPFVVYTLRKDLTDFCTASGHRLPVLGGVPATDGGHPPPSHHGVSAGS